MAPSNPPRSSLAFSVVSAVFFVWGFLTCFNDILVPHLKSLLQLSYGESALVQFSFFGAYFIFSLPAGKVVEKIGYQKSISLGLFIAALGALLFYPAAALASFPLFLGALFVLAAGITFLQVAANPFVTFLGPEKTASSRLNLAQALNSLGTTVAPSVGSFLILSVPILGLAELAQQSPAQKIAYQATQAAVVQRPYLVFAALLVLLSIALYFFPLPSFKAEAKKGQGKLRQVLARPHVVLGVVALFFYVGAEVSIGSFLINFLSQPNVGAMSEQEAAHYVSFYWAGAMVGRFIGSFLLRRFDPGRFLGAAAVVAALLVFTTIVSHGTLPMFTIVAVGLLNSIMFPTIFSLGIRGLGALTESASSLLIMAIVGGAVLPLLQGLLADRIGLQHAFCLPLLSYLFIAYYGFRGCRLD